MLGNEDLTAAEMIPFQRRWRAAQESAYVLEALAQEKRQGGGPFTARCHRTLADRLGVPVLLTQSCTAALEFAATLLDIREGDEVIVPSFTFTSTATAFAIRGARIVFADVDPGTQNIDPQRIAAAVTERTKAIVVMHYGGVACDMAPIERIAAQHHVPIVEDAAQAIGAFAPDGRPLGAIGALGCFSFHDTKNISSGEGGALVVTDPKHIARAEILWEKGTNRSAFLRGEIDKYTWVDIGSSFLPSEITAAMLAAQLEELEAINEARLHIWDAYHDGFAGLEQQGCLRRPVIPAGVRHNAHLYYLMLDSAEQRASFFAHLRMRGVQGAFHYVPLHSSAAGRRFGRAVSSLPNTVRAGDCLARLPLWPGMMPGQIEQTISAVRSFYEC